MMTPITREQQDDLERRLRELESRVDVLISRVNNMDNWLAESRRFHADMTTFKDTLLAEQEVLKEVDDDRHRSNNIKLNFLLAISTLFLAVCSGIGIVLSVIAGHMK